MYDICFTPVNGIVAAIKPANSTWSRIERGVDPAPSGVRFTVAQYESELKIEDGWEVWSNCVYVVTGTNCFIVLDRRNPVDAKKIKELESWQT